MSPECRAIGRLLREHRKRRGLMGFQAATRFNVSPASWSRYESGHQEIPADLLALIAERWQAWDLLSAHPVARATVVSLDVERQRRAMARGGAVLVWAIAYPDGRCEPVLGEPFGPRPVPPAGGAAACA